MNKLTPEQRQKLEIHYHDTTIDFATQLEMKFLQCRYPLNDSCLDNYYSNKELIDQIIDKYKFLLDSDLDPKLLQSLFLKAFLEILSIGPQTHYLNWETVIFERRNEIFVSKHKNRFRKSILVPGFFSTGHSELNWNSSFLKTICESTETIYPLLSEPQKFLDFINIKITSSLPTQISYTYYTRFNHQLQFHKFTKEEYKDNFLRTNKWFFKKLSNCDPLLRNKYKEQLLKEISSSLDLDSESIYWHYPLKAAE